MLYAFICFSHLSLVTRLTQLIQNYACSGQSLPHTMSAALIAKFSEAEADGVSSIANDVAAAVASEGIAALESSPVMAELEVRI